MRARFFSAKGLPASSKTLLSVSCEEPDVVSHGHAHRPPAEGDVQLRPRVEVVNAGPEAVGVAVLLRRAPPAR
eukprot:2662198-Lingulodinium_polyedra.AAC.1